MVQEELPSHLDASPSRLQLLRRPDVEHPESLDHLIRAGAAARLGQHTGRGAVVGAQPLADRVMVQNSKARASETLGRQRAVAARERHQNFIEV